MNTDIPLHGILNIPVIDENRRYWLIRTDSGNLWDQFISDGFVGVGWNEFSDKSTFIEVSQNKEKERALKKLIQDTYEVEQGGRILNQIHRFMFDIKVGDIVMIPSSNNIISFGEVTSDCYIYDLTDEDIDNELCDFIKRRNVKWLDDVFKKDLDPLLFKMLQAHQAISNADAYADVIDRTLEHLYIKNNEVHLIVKVNTINGVGKNLYQLQKLVFDEPIGINSDDMNMKINVQSPGFIEFITNNLKDILVTLMVINFIVGGGKLVGVELPGILSWIHKFMESNRNHKLEKDKLEIEKDKLSFEKDKEIYEQLKDQFGDQLKSLDLETPNQVLNNIVEVSKALSSINPEVVADSNDQDSNNDVQ